jgi:hypothetical protein
MSTAAPVGQLGKAKGCTTHLPAVRERLRRRVDKTLRQLSLARIALRPVPVASVAVVRYLSDEWFDEASRLMPGPAPSPGGTTEGFVVQQLIEDGAGSGSEPVAWHIVVAHGSPRLTRGRHHDPDITLTCDLATAWAVHQGHLSAQAAFMAGRLRLGGDASALLANREALASLDDRLAPLRATTELDS